jgi:hypothetical protein
MKTAAELKVLYDQAREAMGSNPDTADPDLVRAFRSIRRAMITQDRKERDLPQPPPPIPKSERRTSMYQAVDDLTRQLSKILGDDKLERTLDELRGILDSTPGPEADRYRERIAACLDSLTARASAQAASMRRSLP